MTTGLGTPVTLQANLTVWPSSAVQFAKISSKSGGPKKKKKKKRIEQQKVTFQIIKLWKKIKVKKRRGCMLHLLHAAMMYRCCSSLRSRSHEFLMVTVRACKVYFLTESSRSCQISKARSSPSTVSFTSMLFNWMKQRIQPTGR